MYLTIYNTQLIFFKNDSTYKTEMSVFLDLDFDILTGWGHISKAWH